MGSLNLAKLQETLTTTVAEIAFKILAASSRTLPRARSSSCSVRSRQVTSLPSGGSRQVYFDANKVLKFDLADFPAPMPAQNINVRNIGASMAHHDGAGSTIATA